MTDQTMHLQLAQSPKPLPPARDRDPLHDVKREAFDLGATAAMRRFIEMAEAAKARVDEIAQRAIDY